MTTFKERKKSRLIVDEECNLNLWLPPLGSVWGHIITAQIPGSRSPVVKCGLGLGRVNLKTSWLEQLLSSPHPPLALPRGKRAFGPSRPDWKEKWETTSVKWTRLNPSENLQSVLIRNTLGPTVTVFGERIGGLGGGEGEGRLAVIWNGLCQAKSYQGHLNGGQKRAQSTPPSPPQRPP